MQAVNVKSPVLFEFLNTSITSGLLSSLVVALLLILVVIWARRSFGLVPSKMQLVFEGSFNFFKKNIDSAFVDKTLAKRFLPMIFVMFWFILLANQFTIIPFVADLTLASGDKLFQAPTADINLPLAWALMIVVMSHVLALKIAPLKHIGNFLKFGQLLQVRSFKSLANALLEIFLGLLDIIGELARVVSLSARLFGNIFAGELMILVMISIVPYVIPIPFVFLSIFGGLIHAFIFPLLSLQYLALTINSVQKS